MQDSARNNYYDLDTVVLQENPNKATVTYVTERQLKAYTVM